MRCQCFEREGIHDVSLRVGRRKTVVVISSSCSARLIDTKVMDRRTDWPSCQKQYYFCDDIIMHVFCRVTVRWGGAEAKKTKKKKQHTHKNKTQVSRKCLHVNQYALAIYTYKHFSRQPFWIVFKVGFDISCELSPGTQSVWNVKCYTGEKIIKHFKVSCVEIFTT